MQLHPGRCGKLLLIDFLIEKYISLLEISESDKAIIKHSRKTLLFHSNQGKKSGDSDFDVPIGCYDGAQIGELVGIFILNKLSNIIDKNSIGLYRDGGLDVFDKLFGPKIKQRKNIDSQNF